eukprot:3093716-Prymnesium_polylepis.3
MVAVMVAMAVIAVLVGAEEGLEVAVLESVAAVAAAPATTVESGVKSMAGCRRSSISSSKRSAEKSHS